MNNPKITIQARSRLEDKCAVFGCQNVPYKRFKETTYCRYHFVRMSKNGNPYGNQATRNNIYLPEFPGDVAAIEVSSGEIYIFDADDLWLQYYVWQTDRKYSFTPLCYCFSLLKENNRIFMHRLIMYKHGYLSDEDLSLVNDIVVDHKNRITLDNRKCNLRVITYHENSINRTFKYKYQGISFSRDKFHVSFSYNGERIKLNDSFDTLEKAKKARDDAMKLYFKEFAPQNNENDGVYEDKIRRIKLFKENYNDLYHYEGETKKAIYFNYDNLANDNYYRYNRQVQNLPSYLQSYISKNQIPCCICGKIAKVRNLTDNNYYCSTHYSSLRSYGQPFGKKNLSSVPWNTYLRNFNNTGLSALVTNNGSIIMFDAEDYDKIKNYWWQCSTDKHLVYCIINKDEYTRERITLGRVILGLASDSNFISFRNGFKLDYRKSNLIIGNSVMNLYDPEKEKETACGFRGIRKHPTGNYYQVVLPIFPHSERFEKSKLINIGTYDSLKEAINARLEAERKYYGYTCEDMMEDRKIYYTFKGMVQDWLNSFDPNIQAVRPFYFLNEDPNKYPEYIENTYGNWISRYY